ncbi:MAG: hypothetical protein GQ564_05910 [Bacteroidales bacterium]|nr:hypothetical protein [Bacteroidales bacterium]
MKYFLVFFLIFLFTDCKRLKINENKDLWYQNYDFDNDNKIDTITYLYSGGAHCCYKIGIKLSSLKEEIKVPYFIEGGYIVFDLSQQDNFNIYDIDKDNKPEIFINGIYEDSTNETNRQKLYIDFERGVGNKKYFNVVKYKSFGE